MKLGKVAIIGIVAVSAVALAGCKTQSQVSTQESVSDNSSTGEAMVGSAVITFDGTSFNPSEVNIKAGESVTLKNTSGQTVQVNSDPHPTHTLFPELNVGSVAASESKSFKISSAGTYSYHNHLSASQKGTIVVE